MRRRFQGTGTSKYLFVMQAFATAHADRAGQVCDSDVGGNGALRLVILMILCGDKLSTVSHKGRSTVNIIAKLSLSQRRPQTAFRPSSRYSSLQAGTLYRVALRAVHPAGRPLWPAPIGSWSSILGRVDGGTGPEPSALVGRFRRSAQGRRGDQSRPDQPRILRPAILGSRHDVASGGSSTPHPGRPFLSPHRASSDNRAIQNGRDHLDCPARPAADAVMAARRQSLLFEWRVTREVVFSPSAGLGLETLDAQPGFRNRSTPYTLVRSKAPCIQPIPTR